jgi:subfamily B ATP-binding cassette protein MsbA
MVSEGIQQPLNLVAFAGVLIWISPRLFLLVTLLFPPLGGMIYYFSKVLKKNTRKQKQKIDEIGSATTESLFNVRLIKAMGTEQEEVDKYIKRRLQLFKYFMQRRLVKFASGPIMELMGTLAATGILIVGGYAIFGDGVNWIGQLHPVEFGAFLYALTKFYRPMKALSKTFMGFAVTKVAAERLMEMLNLRPIVMETENPVPFDGLKQSIEFRDVCFRYNEKIILDHVNLEIPVGSIVAIVGETGSGKTSIANLLARLFDPTEGQILVDGVDMKNYRMADIRRRLGMVTQDTILFDDTIGNNIAYGVDTSEMTSRERKDAIIAAAKVANADEFIRALDGGKGYRTEIGPTGCRLSGGQAQRIAIARAVFRNPQLLILDEATSALDSQTQASVQEAMNHALQNRTALVISHRLSTIRNADRIYVLDDGRVVESGTFEDLMSGETMFRSLYQAEALAETA